MRKSNKKSRVISNIIFNIIAVISTVLAVVFSIYIYKLDMLPIKYLKIVFIVLGVFYLILLLLTLPRHMKIGFKITACVFFLLFAFVFGYGIKYSDKTLETLDKISYDLAQKEDYEIKVLSSSKLNVKEDLNNKKIGIFKNDRYEDVVKYLKKDITCDLIDYTDPTKFFEDLQEGDITAVIASDTIYSLLEEDLAYMKLDLKTAHTIAVPIDGEIEEVVKVVDVTNTPFNVFIAGGDKRGTIDKVMNTDVNMVVSVDVKNHRLLLTSIPRDYYVNLPGKGENAYDKLTHAGYYGVQESIRAVEKLLDIEINYYAKVNFTTVEKVVDALGGIDVYSDKAFTEDSSGLYYRYKKGKNHLNGLQALSFARERHAFSDGDVQRVKNQQYVIDGIISKMTSSSTLMSKYTNILDAVSKNFSTNLDRKSISKIVKMQLYDMRGWTSESQNLVGYSDSSKNCYSLKGWDLYVMKQNPESVKQNSNKIKEFFGEKIAENSDVKVEQ